MYKHKGSILIGTVIVFVALSALSAASVVGFVLYNNQNTEEVKNNNKEKVQIIDNSSIQPEVVTTTRTVTTNGTTSIGRVSITTDLKEIVTCGSADCFEDFFKRCEPAVLEGEVTSLSGRYKILNHESNGCKLEFEYLKNPNPDWLHKKMLCVYDNNIKFEDSVKRTWENVVSGNQVCEGELYFILKNLGAMSNN